MVDSLLAIHQQREDTARIAECLAGLLCSVEPHFRQGPSRDPGDEGIRQLHNVVAGPVIRVDAPVGPHSIKEGTMDNSDKGLTNEHH